MIEDEKKPHKSLFTPRPTLPPNPIGDLLAAVYRRLLADLHSQETAEAKPPPTSPNTDDELDNAK